MLAPADASAAPQPIATLASMDGTVVVRSNGDWGATPRIGMDLYPDDRIVTRKGKAKVVFLDGGHLEIQNNSNVEIQQWEEKKGFFSKTKKLRRRIMLFLGKMSFDSGNSRAEHQLATPTAVCGLRGTSGVLSIGADGDVYLTFTGGTTSYRVGDFISGVATDVPAEMADLNPVQRAAFIAKAAGMQAEQAEDVNDATMQALMAQAAVAAAEAAKAAANAIVEQNPDPELVSWAVATEQRADSAIVQGEDVLSSARATGNVDETRLVIPRDPQEIANEVLEALGETPGGPPTGQQQAGEGEQTRERRPAGEEVFEVPDPDKVIDEWQWQVDEELFEKIQKEVEDTTPVS